MTDETRERLMMLTHLDVACGRPADPIRAKSLAFVLEDLPTPWLREGCKRIAQTRQPTEFPATAAEIYKAAWKAAGFTHKYNPALVGDAAYLEPRIGDVRWWPEPNAQIPTGDRWDWLPPSGAAGVIGSGAPDRAQIPGGESLGGILGDL